MTDDKTVKEWKIGEDEKAMKKIFDRIFIDGLSGMALGLFSTLIIGTILAQIGELVGGTAGTYILAVANVAKTLTGAGIGVGVACKFKEDTLVTVSAAVAGMIGAFPNLLETLTLGKPGEPLGAFVAAYVAIEAGQLVSGKTKLDILVTPLVAIGFGALAGFLIGPYISMFMRWLGGLVNVNVEKQPIIGGIVVSVLMGMILTLPISSAAIGVSLGLSGLAAGAAVLGCSCQMVGFAVMSFRENGWGGLVRQGIGTSMIQIPNIMRKPLIWLPPTLTSAILAPVATVLLKMQCNPVGSGMGTSGLVGQIMTWQTMAGSMNQWLLLLEIVMMHFVLPGVITWVISEGMRKAGWIHQGDMRLSI